MLLTSLLHQCGDGNAQRHRAQHAAGILITAENFIDWTSWALFAGAFIASQWLKMNPILIIILGGVIGYFIY